MTIPLSTLDQEGVSLTRQETARKSPEPATVPGHKLPTESRTATAITGGNGQLLVRKGRGWRKGGWPATLGEGTAVRTRKIKEGAACLIGPHSLLY